MRMKTVKMISVFIVGMLLTAVAACSSTNNEAGLANPASVHCEEQGGRLELRQDVDGGQYGVCIFDDGSECEEWAFFREECGPGEETIAWEMAADLIRNGLVTSVFQTHALDVTLELKDGRSLHTIESQIDDVFKVIDQCGDICQDITMITE